MIAEAMEQQNKVVFGPMAWKSKPITPDPPLMPNAQTMSKIPKKKLENVWLVLAMLKLSFSPALLK